MTNDDDVHEEKPLVVNGITEEQFNMWRHQPVTEMLFKFLEDRRLVIKASLLDRWETGALTLMDEKEMRGRIMESRELDELRLPAIAQFYSTGEQEDGPIGGAEPQVDQD